MIRLAEQQDLDRIMEIWLEGNLQAHDFVDPDYWTGCFQEVREAIAQADVWVWDENDRVEAFAGMVEHYLAGLFVSGTQRGKGIGGLLLEHIKEQRFPLTLHVYSRNAGAVQFYERHGFGTVSEYIDPETGQPEREMIFPPRS